MRDITLALHPHEGDNKIALCGNADYHLEDEIRYQLTERGLAEQDIYAGQARAMDEQNTWQ